MANETTPLYYGDDCGVPIMVWTSDKKSVTFKRRQTPRRLIHALPMNHEFDIFETVTVYRKLTLKLCYLG